MSASYQQFNCSLAPYRLVLVAAPSYLAAHGPIDMSLDLSRYKCLSFSHTVPRTHGVFDGPEGRVTAPVSGRFLVNSGEALMSVALAGMGLMLQPLELVQAEFASGRLVMVQTEYSPDAANAHPLRP